VLNSETEIAEEKTTVSDWIVGIVNDWFVGILNDWFVGIVSENATENSGTTGIVTEALGNVKEILGVANDDLGVANDDLGIQRKWQWIRCYFGYDLMRNSC